MRSAITALLLLGLPALAFSQSLGEAAAKERARREKEKAAKGTKPIRTYSNGDLPAEGEKKEAVESSGGSYTPSGSSGLRPGRTVETEDGSESEGSPQSARQQLEAARARVADAQKQVDELRRKLNPMSVTYNQDTNNGETATLLRLRSELTQAEAALADAQKEVGPAQEAVDRAGRSGSAKPRER
jgi:hypothetical protein